MISERYKRLRYEEGRRVGREEGIKVAELALGCQRQRFRQFLQKAGVELNDEDAESLFGSPDELAQDNGAKG